MFLKNIRIKYIGDLATIKNIFYAHHKKQKIIAYELYQESILM